MVPEAYTLNLDREQRELHPHGSLEFPCAGYDSRYPQGDKPGIPWHRHRELEVLLLVERSLRIQIPGTSLLLQAGEGCFINAGVLHAGVAERTCHLHSLVFSPTLLSGTDHSVFARHYLFPLTRPGTVDIGRLDPSDPEQRASLTHIATAFSAMAEEPVGYEFQVRDALSQVVLSLCQIYCDLESAKTWEGDVDAARMEKMLEVIRRRYGDGLTLPDIARAADIGERECLRCFQRVMHLSPIQYLIRYRLLQGAAMLVEAPALTVAEISTRCGFDSPSNFSKTFRRLFACTPRTYRRQRTGESGHQTSKTTRCF